MIERWFIFGKIYVKVNEKGIIIFLLKNDICHTRWLADIGHGMIIMDTARYDTTRYGYDDGPSRATVSGIHHDTT